MLSRLLPTSSRLAVRTAVRASRMRILSSRTSSSSPRTFLPAFSSCSSATSSSFPLRAFSSESTSPASSSESSAPESSSSSSSSSPPPPATPTVRADSTKKLNFQAETRQILDIVANSLYTDKEVFLRELISNASDALEKARYFQSTGQKLLDGEKGLEIRITLDETEGKLIVEDYGIGMTADELVSHLGTIARSGSKAFMNELKSGATPTDTSNIIGRFGVGFYSTFMVGDKVEVFSQSAINPDSPSHYWSSDGSGSYELSELTEQMHRGTKVVVHLKPNQREYAAKNTIESIIKKYSNFVGFPIYLNNEKVNTVGALWAMNKDSITDEQHNEFYRYYGNAYDTPIYRLHFTIDAPIAIQALFYFPERHMEKYGMGRLEPGVNLYSRKVLIKSKSKEVLPEWLRFVKGVVDSEDIPLNISRENMQDSKLVNKINNILVKKIIRFLEEQSKADRKKYDQFFEEFGQFIKEGVCTDWNNKAEAAKLLRFETSLEAGKLFSLDEYISRMPTSQSSIYYLNAPSRNDALSSPYYESFKAKGIEVLFLYQHIDDFVVKNLNEYQKRELVSIDSALDGRGKKEGGEEDEEEEKENEDFEEDRESEKKKAKEAVNAPKGRDADLVAYLRKALDGRASSVKISDRLVTSPAMIVDHESAALRRMMKYVDQKENPMFGAFSSKQKLEINPKHPLLQKLLDIKDTQPELAQTIADQIFDNALIAADIMDNPRVMLNRLNKLMETALQMNPNNSSASTSAAASAEKPIVEAEKVENDDDTVESNHSSEAAPEAEIVTEKQKA